MLLCSAYITFAYTISNTSKPSVAMSKYWAEIEKTIKKNIELYEAGTPPEIINFLDIDMEVELDWSEQVAYDRYLKRIWDYDNMLRGEREYAMAQGEARGIAIGEAKGLAKGKAEGRAEGQSDVAKNLKNLGVPIDIIIQATGLTKEQIDAL